jgi:DNA repair photolyase
MERARRLAGRGTGDNPANRYEEIHVEPDETVDGEAAEAGAPPTVFYRDTSRSILAENDSPDLDFRFSLNPYRGCEHGCIYCYARPSHEYLSFSAGLDFERRIMIKPDAAELLRRTFMSPRWQPQTVALSGNTDCYQPVEHRLQLTRRCLEVFSEFVNPVSITTKSALVTRDIDLLCDLASHGATHVILSITSLDGALTRRMEPRAAQPERRLEAVHSLSAAGIPTGVLIAPVIPGLNDEEIPRILKAAAAAGAWNASWTLVRLPEPVDQLFVDWLGEQFPERRERVLGRIRTCRDGRLNDTSFGRRLRGEGPYAEQISALFRAAARRHGLDQSLPSLNASAFRQPRRAGEQLALYQS